MMMKKMSLRIVVVVFAVFLSTMLASAQTTAFTFQGRLNDGASPANGTYEMEFRLFDAVAAGAQVGGTITNNSVSVVNGIFTVQLDFTATPFAAGANRWVQVSVRKASDPPGFTTLSPRQPVGSQPYAIRANSAANADNATNATNATSAGNVTGVVGIANGGTGSATGDGSGLNNLNGSNIATGTVADARLSTNVTVQGNTFNGNNQLVQTNGSGELPSVSGVNLTNLNASNLASGTVGTARLGTGTANSTTYLRGDNTWQTIATSGVTGSGSNNYLPKFTPAAGSNIGNSQIQDNGTSIGINTAPVLQYRLYLYNNQLTTNGDGQHSLFGYRTRDSQNDGTAYGVGTTNTGTTGYTFWGDLYTFGVGGFTYGDYTRTGGVLGAEQSGATWGSLGYKSSASTWFGVYGSAAAGTGTGRPTYGLGGEQQGIGGGFYGGMIGSFSRGDVMGNVSSGELFASYNVGNVYTSGFTADLVDVKTGNGAQTERVAAYAVTATGLKAYDNGSARLDGDSVFVPFSKVYAGMLAELPDVTVSAVGSPAQLYIKSIEKGGFTVAVASGTANVKFSWIAVGNRVDSEKAKALPAEIANKEFDTQLKEVMFNENDKENSGKSMWWDGSKVRFDKAPEPQKPAKVEIKPKN